MKKAPGHHRQWRARAIWGLGLLSWLLAALLLWHGQWWAGTALIVVTGCCIVSAACALPVGRRPAVDELTRRQARCGDDRFRALLEGLTGAAVQGYDRHRRVVFWNEASTRLYGYRYEEAWGHKLEELIIPLPMREAVIRRHQAWVDHGIPIPAERLRLQDRSGQPVDVYSYHVMFDSDTDSPVMFCVDVGLDVPR